MNEELSSPLDNSIELIDATQNAVIEAVDNVSGLISETAETVQTTEKAETHEHEFFYQSPEFWVGLAFVLAVVSLAKPVGKLLKSMLIKRRDGIIDRINQAEKLHDDAQKLLAEYERKYMNAEAEAHAVLEKSKQQIERTRQQELAKLQSELNLKKRETEGIIASSEWRTLTEINTKASAKAMALVREYIEHNSDKAQHTRLIDESIDRILAKF